MKGLLTVERLVLESLGHGQSYGDDIQGDTGLDSKVLQKVLDLLIKRGIISYRDSRYSLNLENKSEWMEQIKEKNAVKAEVKELFASLVNDYYKQKWDGEASLCVKKIWPTSEQRMALLLKLNDIDNFIETIKRDETPCDKKTKDKQVFIWGTSSYGRLINDMLRFLKTRPLTRPF